MSRPTRSEQRRARRTLIMQGVTILLALLVVSVTGRGPAPAGDHR